MPIWISDFISLLCKEFLLPAIGIVATIILQQLASKAKKVMNSADDRNHKEALNAVSSITSQSIAQLDTIVASAIACTATLAETYKTDDTPKLTEEEIIKLNVMAKDLVYKMLPTEITCGSLTALLGGKESLDAMISGSIEKQLIAMKK